MTIKSVRSVVVVMMMSFTHAIGAQTVPPRVNEPPRSVTLTLAEYNRLTDAANRTTVPAPVAPVAAVLASADLRVRVDGATVRGAFTLAGQVLRPGVSRVTLLSDATVLDANADGRPLALLVDGHAHEALLSGPGPFTANLEWGAPLTLKPGRASFMLPVPPAGSVHATIEVPGDQADVRLTAGSITHRSSVNGRTLVEATLDPPAATEVSWSMRDSAPVAALRETRTVADVLTLMTLADSDVRMVALIDLTVVQGEPRAIELRLPSGYELTGITGSSVEASEPVDRQVKLTLADPAARRHQLLVTLERSHPDGSFNFDTAFVEVADVERERGEVAVEGVGTLDLVAAERGGMHRIDVKELNTSLQALARTPLLSGFRYQRTAAESPALALAVTRFADSSVLAAMVDRAVATTLITSEGRALTEVTLSVRNRAQSFLKVTLPGGATIVSVTVAGQPAKPVLGDDGSRVPLLRPGFRPAGPYEVSFVYLHAGAPFLRSGDLTMTLPHMDIPVGVVEWEVFAPDNYSLRFVDGNAITQQALDRAVGKAVGPHAAPISAPASLLDGVGSSGGIRISLAPGEGAGRIRGVVKDASGAVLPGVTVTITSRTGTPFSATSASDGTFLITGVQPGIARINASIPGFQTAAASFVVGDIGHRMEITMNVGSLAETVSVSGQSPRIDRHPEEQKVEPSQNVINLQRRVQGVLPIRVEVPRAGTSYRFSRPLVVDDETRVAFHYKRK